MGWQMRPLRVMWIEGRCGASSVCLIGSYTPTFRREVYLGVISCVMVVGIMGLVCYFACPELVLAGALTSHPHVLGMTPGAPEGSFHGI